MPTSLCFHQCLIGDLVGKQTPKDFLSQIICDFLKIPDFVIREIFFLRQYLQVGGLLFRPLVGNGCADCFQDSLARDQCLFVHVEALPFPLEYFSLHLSLKIGTQCCLLLAILFNSTLVVFVVAHLPDRGHSFWIDPGVASGVLHILGGDLSSQYTGMRVSCTVAC